MKKLISFFILTLLGFTAYSQKRVNFEDITYEEALVKAKATVTQIARWGKLILFRNP